MTKTREEFHRVWLCMLVVSISGALGAIGELRESNGCNGDPHPQTVSSYAWVPLRAVIGGKDMNWPYRAQAEVNDKVDAVSYEDMADHARDVARIATAKKREELNRQFDGLNVSDYWRQIVHPKILSEAQQGNNYAWLHGISEDYIRRLQAHGAVLGYDVTSFETSIKVQW